MCPGGCVARAMYGTLALARLFCCLGVCVCVCLRQQHVKLSDQTHSETHRDTGSGKSHNGTAVFYPSEPVRQCALPAVSVCVLCMARNGPQRRRTTCRA